MDKLPQRDDLIYKEIEEFQDYELTNCVAYEMAIRNKEFKNLLNDVELIRKNYFKVAKMYAETKTAKYNLKTSEDVINIVKDKIDDFMEFRKNKIRDKLSEIYKKFGLALFDTTNNSVLDDIKDVHFRTKGSLQNMLEFKEENKDGQLEFLSTNYNLKLDLPKEVSRKEVSRIEYVKNNLMIVTSRPKIDSDKSHIIEMKLNLNLPKEELIAYLSKIKDDFDKDNSIIKTPLELLGETLEKSDNKKTPKKPKAFVYADWFYIYDYWKYEKTQGKTDKDIFVALEVENNVPYKEDMIRKIRDKMKYFIDDLGYKELITGVKNS
ncbi:hypothetical protein L5F68_01920 [Aliarcobacter butzleri]|uniref:hypothetical protein n=1 Tax=Aliarcobacter butzleri TaxID=28197 RepID=UPI001EDA946D|nr:hypothetical protein [Aliarcobacter butzleri]MCG3688766.1 hypothetical protein [Aliarcobacter butzleri]MCG3703084.1 hypothetical protein [Aliarcobacter butzleri]MCG3707964.1 hypothetical protein [Aliarcobacter butzleri]MDS1370168.1 hypothetical protein [Aliarcobacter butzleri]